ncbi:hypothetical protein RF11_02468 [Thelohanellus kitauei]|uniref:Voltage-dependent L-type calcium channel IQ-associated domain-containing protein n=1 Tax=Thelohanellus kitauei TaxID=669202 RepID=A0A0C2MIX1_THEKT|nr:hypothetical protein RF11_02468 [Thelohanellus kitauei]
MYSQSSTKQDRETHSHVSGMIQHTDLLHALRKLEPPFGVGKYCPIDLAYRVSLGTGAMIFNYSDSLSVSKVYTAKLLYYNYLRSRGLQDRIHKELKVIQTPRLPPTEEQEVKSLGTTQDEDLSPKLNEEIPTETEIAE